MAIFEAADTARRDRSRQDRLALFTDRKHLVHRFTEYVNSDVAVPTVLYVHGMGGNGKSLLLQYLERHCCRRLPRAAWAALHERAEVGPEDLAGGRPVPVAVLDFGMPPTAELRAQEPLSGLFAIKRQMAASGVPTPRFDFAAVTYLHRTGASTDSKIRELFPAEEVSLASDIVDALAQVPVLSAATTIAKLVDRRTDSAVSRWKYRRKVDSACVQEVLALRPQPDLLLELPRFLAEDLNEAIGGEHERLVLMFDTHEAFWGEGDAPGPASLSGELLSRDEWVRRLVGHLDLERGIVVAFAGRQPPQWSRAPRAAIPERFVELVAIEHLSRADADSYLVRAGVADPLVRAHVLDYVSGGDDACHPYLLGMSADVAAVDPGVLTPASSGPWRETAGDRERALVMRLLQWVTADVELAIVSLAAARAFDLPRFRAVGEATGFASSASDYERLVRFSFVTPAPSATGGETYAVHRLLRRFVAALRPEDTERAHQALEDYYRQHVQRLGHTAMVEALYHRFHRLPEEAAAEWLQLADQWLGRGRFPWCRTLLACLKDVDVPAADRHAVLQRVGRIHLRLGDVASAEDVAAVLPEDSSGRALLTSEVAFMRGKLSTARAVLVRTVPRAGGSDRQAALLLLTEYALFLGAFPDAVAHSREGLRIARAGGDQAAEARWLVLHGEVEVFSGDLYDAERCFTQAVRLLEDCPADECDSALLACAEADRGLLAETRRDWPAALEHYGRALVGRQECGDVRGVAHSRHALGKALARLGRKDDAERELSAATTSAAALGDSLLLNKLAHTKAQLLLDGGDAAHAADLLADVVPAFRDNGAPFDIAHGLLTAARAAECLGVADRASAARAEARRLIDRGGFGLLLRLYPEVMRVDERVRGSLVAFCLGDALGAPWEGRPPQELVGAPLDDFPVREDWLRGATTDDTAQALLTARVLVDGGGPADFLRALADALPTIRGAGPTSTAAVGRFLAEGTVEALSGSTNGAAMRAVPFGWVFPEPSERRTAVERFSRTTHGDARAVLAAAVVAGMTAAAMQSDDAVAAAREELRWGQAHFHLDDAAVEPLARALAGEWAPPATGVSLDALETAAAVVHVVAAEHGDLASALRASVALGGDTDTVAAIVGGVLGAARPRELADHPWLATVQLPSPTTIGALVRDVTAMRGSRG